MSVNSQQPVTEYHQLKSVASSLLKMHIRQAATDFGCGEVSAVGD